MSQQDTSSGSWCEVAGNFVLHWSPRKMGLLLAMMFIIQLGCDDDGSSHGGRRDDRANGATSSNRDPIKTRALRDGRKAHLYEVINEHRTAVIADNESVVTIIDENGQAIGTNRFCVIGSYTDGFAFAQLAPDGSGSPRGGIIDVDGSFVIGPYVNYGIDERLKLFPKRQNGLWGMVRSDGSWVVLPEAQQPGEPLFEQAVQVIDGARTGGQHRSQ